MKSTIIKGIIFFWILVTCAAIVGMFRLWWQRERVLYWGKDITAQRVLVLERAGIAPSILDKFKEIDSTWPMEINYMASGDHNQLSYLKYLLIPRIPSGSSEHQIRIKGSNLDYKGLSSIDRTKRTYAEKPKFYGLLISIICMLGAGFIFQSIYCRSCLSISESTGLSSLMLMVLAMVSMILFNRTTYGFALFGIGGIFGWVLFFKKSFFLLRENISRFFSQRYRSAWYNNILIALGLALFMWSMLMAVVVVPDDWDAWAIWGSKAKVLALSHGPLKNVTYFDHQDYPLLWPAVWAFTGWCAGGWEEHWSKGWGPLFMLLTAWQIYSIIKRETDETNIAMTGAIMFLSVPMVPLVASWSYAEAPLWLMMTCSFGCVMRWRKDGLKSDLMLVSLFAAAAAYTKNEGVLFALLIFLWVLIVKIKDWKNAVIIYLVPFAIMYLPWAYWIRITLKMKSHATIGISMHHEQLSMALSRLPETLTLIGRIWMDIKQWNIVLLFIGLILLVMFFKDNKNDRIDLMLPVSLLLGYLVITLFHYNSLGYQVGSSWNRLTLHAMPMFIVTIMSGMHKLKFKGWNPPLSSAVQA